MINDQNYNNKLIILFVLYYKILLNYTSLSKCVINNEYDKYGDVDIIILFIKYFKGKVSNY